MRTAPTCECGARMYWTSRRVGDGTLLYRECRSCHRVGFFRYGIEGSFGGLVYSEVDQLEGVRMLEGAGLRQRR